MYPLKYISNSLNNQLYENQISISPIEGADKCLSIIDKNSYIGIFLCVLILIENFYLIKRKQTKNYLVEKKLVIFGIRIAEMTLGFQILVGKQ